MTIISGVQSNPDTRRFHYSWTYKSGESKYFGTYKSDVPKYYAWSKLHKIMCKVGRFSVYF